MSLLRTRKGRRLAVVLLGLLGLGSATGLALMAFNDTLVFFVTPGDMAENPPPAGRTLRLGGLVENGSVLRDRREGKPVARFRVTDGRAASHATVNTFSQSSPAVPCHQTNSALATTPRTFGSQACEPQPRPPQPRPHSSTPTPATLVCPATRTW